MAQDYYEILQIHPRADLDAITAAYQWLCEAYNPALLEGGAPELAALARQRCDEFERAYTVLGDPVCRAEYDAELARRLSGPVSESSLDDRPLSLARRAGRPRIKATQLLHAVPTRRLPRPRIKQWWGLPLALAGLIVVVISLGLALAGAGGPPSPPPLLTPAAFDQFEALIPQAKRAAEQNPTDPQAWIAYGHALYDSAQIVREQAPDSALYLQRLPHWLQATQAYSRALTLQPDNPSVRADLGASACFYGIGTGDLSYVHNGLNEARRAAQAAPDDARVLLSLTFCLISTQPPQIEEARQNWRRVVQLVPADSPLAIQAWQLIERYSSW